MSAGLTTSDVSYYQPLCPKLSILSNDGSTTLITYDAFNPNANSYKVLQVVVDLAQNQTGTFSIFMEDHNQIIDRTQVGCGCRVVISAGKTNAVRYDLLHGYIKNISVNRDDTGILYYEFSGYGSQIILSERIIDFQKLAARDSSGNPVSSTVDPSLLAYNLVKTVFESSAILPFPSASPTLLAQGGFTENGIDVRVNNNIFGIVEPLVEASAVLGKIADDSGAIWGIQNDDIFFRYPTAIHSGITIKGGGVSATDLADKTAYMTGSYSYTESTDQAQGFSNRLVLKGGAVASNPSTSSTSTTSFTTLFNKDIAQQIIPSSAQLRNLALTLSLVGTGGVTTSQTLTGALIQDSGTGVPNGAKVADFSIPLSSIPATPTSVFDFNYKWYVQTLQPNAAYWIVLYAKGTDENNTVSWHNDGDTTTENRFSATRQVTLDTTTEARTQFPLKNDTGGWSTSDTGPVYTHDFFENVRVLTEASDPNSIQKYGLVESIVDVPWIIDNQSLQNYATALLAYTAKPIRQYTMQAVTIPNNMVYFPGQLIDINDPLGNMASPKTLSVEIQEVNYTFVAANAGGGDPGMTSSAPSGGGTRLANPLGTQFVTMLCTQYVDYLVDSLS